MSLPKERKDFAGFSPAIPVMPSERIRARNKTAQLKTPKSGFSSELRIVKPNSERVTLVRELIQVAQSLKADLKSPDEDDLVTEPTLYNPEDDSYSLYLRDIGKHKQIPIDEQIRLGRILRRGHIASAAIINAPDEEKAELEKQKRQAEIARNALIESNLDMVVALAWKSPGRNFMSIEDLIQEGNIGLLEAVDRFDPERGNKFTTYAYERVRRAISGALRAQSRTIRLPDHIIDILVNVNKTVDGLRVKLGREPDIQEVAGELNYTSERIAEIIQTARIPDSLERPVVEEGESELGDFIAAEDPDTNPVVGAEKNNLSKILQEEINQLGEREGKAVHARFRLDRSIGRYEVRTNQELEECLGYSRELARQDWQRGVARLRNTRVRKKLKEYLE